MIAIHNNFIGFTPYWIKYCEQKNIQYKLVNAYSTNIVNDLQDCDAFMWHHWQTNSKDILKAKRLLFALEQSGFVVFPNFNTNWHFDDKFGQKYLLESLQLPLVNSYQFVEKGDALRFVEATNFPKVFKLRGGAGSLNVRIVSSKKEAIRLIEKSFSRGFMMYDRLGALKERVRKFRKRKESLLGILKSLYRAIDPPKFAKLLGRQKFEIYFQDFIPNNDHDIRVIVIQNKAFAIKRLVRENDFRASGSGNILYEKQLFDESLIKKSFEYHAKLGSQVTAFDYVFDQSKNPLIVEISYGYAIEGYLDCPGYWDSDLNFHEESFNSCEWMVELVLNEISSKKK